MLGRAILVTNMQHGGGHLEEIALTSIDSSLQQQYIELIG